jgi:hypothetical protein
MRCTVQEMRLFTVATDSRESLADGTVLTSIWKATVSREPPVVRGLLLSLLLLSCDIIVAAALRFSAGPSGRMAKPDGRSAT